MVSPTLYAEELRCLGHGLPLWDPQPTSTGGVQIGDVGYMQDGCFFRLFNAFVAADHLYNRHGVPVGHIPFHCDPALLDISERYLHAGIHIGRNAMIERSMVPNGAQQRDRYIASLTGNGSLLALSSSARREVLLPSQALDSYFQEHRHDWFAYATGVCGITCNLDDILLVRGWVKTSSNWGVATWMVGTDTSILAIDIHDDGMEIRDNASCPGIEIKISPRRVARRNVAHPNLRAPAPARTKALDQCIFLIDLTNDAPPMLSLNGPSATYAHHLASPTLGVPLWYPDYVYRTTHEVQIGDVGLIHQGAFHRFFNITVDAQHPWNVHGVPCPFRPAIDAGAWRYHDSFLDPGIRVGGGLRLRHTPCQAYGQTIAQTSETYDVDCDATGGALLLLSRPSQSSTLLPDQAFDDYARKSCTLWHDFITRRLGVSCKLEDVILVRGFVKASRWVAATFTSNGADGYARGQLHVFSDGRFGWSELRKQNMTIGFRCSESCPYEDGTDDRESLDECIFLTKYDFESNAPLLSDTHISYNDGTVIQSPTSGSQGALASSLLDTYTDQTSGVGVISSTDQILRTDSPIPDVASATMTSSVPDNNCLGSDRRSRDIWMTYILEVILQPSKRYRYPVRPGRRTGESHTSIRSENNGEISLRTDLRERRRRNTVMVTNSSADRVADDEVADLLKLALQHETSYDRVVDIGRSKTPQSSKAIDTVFQTMQEVLDIMRQAKEQHERSDDISAKQRASLRQVLLKLCRCLGYIPPSLFLVGVVCTHQESPSAGGSFADIFRAHYDGRDVALKRLRVFKKDYDASENQMPPEFYQEAMVWRQLQHPHIVEFLGLDRDVFTGMLCMVSPWMAGGNVNNCIRCLKKDGKPVPLARWTCNIASGLRYLHSEHIIHGDLRGANILVDHDYRAHITDFGLSHLIDVTRSTTGDTTFRSGACRWMAPEILSGSKPSYAADVYSFGCVCLEMRDGKAPFAHLLRDHQVITAKIMTGLSPRWSDVADAVPVPVDEKFCSLVSLCWSPDAAERPTMDVLERDLIALFST